MSKPKPLKPVLLAVSFKQFYLLKGIAEFTFKRIVMLKGNLRFTLKHSNSLKGILLAVSLSLVFGLSYLITWSPSTAYAATTNTINFQARLENASGSIVPDGTYNVEFKLYNALSSSGSSQGSCTGDAACLWHEDYLVSGSTGVSVSNGYLTVNLGSQTAFPSTIPWGQPLYLGINIGGTGSSPTWDGEMTPRLTLTAVPAAFSLESAAGSFTSTLTFVQPTASESILLPAESGSTETVCYQNDATNCGYIASQTSQQASANFNISGEGQLATLDATGSGTANTLTIGSTASTTTGGGINIGTSITTGVIAIGGTAQTGNITVGQFNAASGTSTINIGDNTATGGTQSVNIAASGSGTNNVTVGSTSSSSTTTINGGTGSSAINLYTNSSTSGTLIKTLTNSTVGLQVQNAAGKDVLSVDTSSNSAQGQVVLGLAGTNNGVLLFQSSTASGGAVTLQAPAITSSSSYSLTLPTSAPGTSQCLESGSSTASQLAFTTCGGGTSTLQQSYNASNGAAPSITLNNASDPAFTIQNTNSSPISGTLFGVYSNTSSGLGSSLFTVASTGDAAVTSTDTAGTALNVTGNSLTSGTGAQVSSTSITTGTLLNVTTGGSANTLTSGNLVNISSASVAQSGAGALLNVSDGGTLTTNGGSDTGSIVNVSRALVADVSPGGAPTLDHASTFDAGSSGKSGTWNNTFTITANSNRYLMVGITEPNCTAPAATTGVQYDGVDMTLLGSTDPYASYCSWVYGLVNPSATGSNTLAITPTSGTAYYSVVADSWYNVNQTTPYGSFTDGIGPNVINNSTASVSAASSSGEVVVDFMANSTENGETGTATPSGTQAAFHNYDASTDNEIGSSYTNATGSSTYLQWTGLAYSANVSSDFFYIWSDDAIGLNPVSSTSSITSPVASVSNNCTLTLGACTDATNVLSLNQQYGGATGAVLNIQNSGSGSAINVTANSVSSGTGDNETYNGLTSGYGLDVTTTSALQSSGGALVNVSDTATLATGNGSDYANLLNVSRSLTANIPGGSSSTPTLDVAGTGPETLDESENDTWTTSYTVSAANTNRFLLVQIVDVGEVCGADGEAATYNGVSMTEIGCANGPDAVATQSLYFFGLVAPATGSNTLHVTTTTAAYVMLDVSDWYNVNQTTPYPTSGGGIFTTTNGSTSTASLSASSLSGQTIVDGLGAFDDEPGDPTQNSGQFLMSEYNDTSSNDSTLADSYKPAAISGGTTSMGWTGIPQVIGEYSWEEASIGLNGSGAGGSEYVTAPVASFSSNCTNTGSSTCSDASNVVSINQEYGTATGAVLNVQGSGSGNLIQANNGSSVSVFSVGSTGNTTINPSTNSTTAFQLQNSTGTNILDGNTTNVNLVTTPTLTSSTATNWVAKGTATVSGDTTNPYEGIASIEAAATATSSGMQTSALNPSTLASTQYQLTFWAKCSSSISTFAYGRDDVSGTDIDATTTATCNTTWQQYTWHFTTGGTITSPNIYMDSGTTSSVDIWVDGVSLVQTSNNGPTNYQPGSLYLNGIVSNPTIFENNANSADAFQIQNAAAEPVFIVNTTTPNLITNPGFEAGTSGWTNDGASTLSWNNGTASTYLGQASLAVALPGSGTTGATVSSFTTSIVPGSYTFSFYAMGSGALSGLAVSITGGTTPTCTLNLATVSSGGFQQYYCNFTSTTTNVTAINITSTSHSATLYIDAAQLTTTGTTSPSPYQIGSIQLRGVITNPVTLEATSNSNTALQIANASGAVLVGVDTLDSTVNLTSTSTASPLLNLTNNSAATNNVETITANALTTGIGLNIVSTSANLSTGALGEFTDNSATTATGGLVQISGTGLTTGIGLLVTANSLSTGAAIEISSTGTTETGGLEQIVGNSLTTGIGESISANALTTGYGLEIVSTETTATTTGGLAEFIANSATTATGGLVQITANALTTGIGLNIVSTSANLSTGALGEFTDNSATTATGGLVQISGTGLTTGIGLLVTANSLSTGAAIEISSTGTTETGGLEQIVGNSLTTGIGESISANALTTGYGLEIVSTETTATTTGGLAEFIANSATTATGGLVQITANALTTGIGLNIVSTSANLSTGALGEFTDNSATTATGGLVQISGTGLTTGIGLLVTANSLSTGAAIEISSTGTTETGGLEQIVGNSLTTGIGESISANALTTGYGLEIVSTETTATTTGGLAEFIANSATTATGGLVQITANALTTGIGLNIVSTSANLSTGALGEFTDNSATTATGGLVQISGTGLTTGIGLLVTANSLSTGAAIEISSTGTTETGGLEQIVGNSLTTGVGLNISATGLTSGSALSITSGTTGNAILFATGNIVNLAAGTAADDVIFRLPTSTTCASGSAQGLVFKNNTPTQEGHICTSSSGSDFYGTAFNSGDTDVAENYSDVSNNLKPGELVALDPSGPTDSVVAANTSNASNIIGIVSTSPGVLLSGISDSDGSTNLIHPIPIALSGRVPTYVSTQNGPIAVGDYLTISSTTGVAMKATSSGMIVGRALQAYNGQGVGQIQVFAQNSFNLVNNTISDNLSVNGMLDANNGLQVMGPAVFNGSVTFNGQTTFNSDYGGYAVIHAGQSQVQVTFATPYDAEPVVTISSNDGQFVDYSYDNLTADGFTIVIPKAATKDESFSWSAIGVQNAATSEISTDNP